MENNKKRQSLGSGNFLNPIDTSKFSQSVNTAILPDSARKSADTYRVVHSPP